MTRLPLLLLCLLTGFASSAQQNAGPAAKYTISGLVTSEKNGETLIGATVRVAGAGTVTNAYGFYSITLPEGTYHLQVSAIGMQTRIDTVHLERNTRLNVALAEATLGLEGVTVSASRAGRSLVSPLMGVNTLSATDIKNVPALMGERDVLKAIQLLPGIKSAGDGNSGFYVRGGSSDQNLILLDDAPVYNASHLLGFFSTFNADAVKNITVYKGDMPAQYGGRLSSVEDIRMNDGDNQDYHVSGGVGLISAKLNVEGPIQKGKSSFLVTARRTYADLFLKLSPDSTINNNKLYFYDLNAKMNYVLGDKDRLYFSGYFGRDVLGVQQTFGLDWGNKTATLRWNHLYSDKLFSNTSLIFSDYNYNISVASGADDFHIFSQIKDWHLKEEFDWYLANNHQIRFGINSIYHVMRPGEVRPTSSDADLNADILEKRFSWENAAYLSDAWKVSSKLNVTYGLRLSVFSILGKGDFFKVDADGNVTDTLHYTSGQFVKTYLNPEPRLALSYQLDPTSSVKLSYARNVQNLHLISNSTASNPTDKWVASTNIIRPEIADQVSAGYYKNLWDDTYEVTVETYYKAMQHQIDYRDGADVFINTNAIESELLFGKGRAYGIEWLLKKTQGRFTGWLSYTLSRTELKIAGINQDQWYNARQDRTHDISIMGTYQLNKKWSFSGDWVFYTGDAVTFPSGKYLVDNQVVFYYTKRNAYRMPAYHRLDLSATLQLKQKKRFSSNLVFGIYNVYGRENAYTITFRQSEDDPDKTEAVQTALFRFIPSVSYDFKF